MALSRGDHLMVSYHAWRNSCAATDLAQMLEFDDDELADLVSHLKTATSYLFRYYQALVAKESKGHGISS